MYVDDLKGVHHETQTANQATYHVTSPCKLLT